MLKNWVAKSQRLSFSRLLLFCHGLNVEPSDAANKHMDIKVGDRNQDLVVIKHRAYHRKVPEVERLGVG